MNKDNKLLEIVSNDVKNSIEQLSIVTPSIYTSLFAELAKKNNLEIENEENISKDILNLECSKLTDLQEQTAKNVQALDTSASKAIDAIQNKDETLLQHILEETKSLRREIEALKKSVYHDELTHAFNRKWLHDNYVDEKENFKTDGTLVIIDLNYFKQINDTLGHIVGDKVLVLITNELKKLRVPVVRYGGDEFLLIFSSDTKKSDAINSLNTIRERVIAKKFKANNKIFRTSFSFGNCTFQKDNNLAEVIEQADKDMYQDKIDIKKRIKGIEV